MSAPLEADVVLYESDRIPRDQITHPPNVGESLFAGVRCPNCGYWVEMALDLSAGEQDYIDDCPTCCRPIEMKVHTHDLQLDSIEALKVH